MTGNTGNTGNVGNAGSGGGNATAISTGWFFADREDLPFVTEHSSSAGFIARQLRPIENFGEHNWSADWFAYRVLIQFGPRASGGDRPRRAAELCGHRKGNR